MKNKHLTFEERILIEEKLYKGYTINRIATELSRPASTIAREVMRNRVERKNSTNFYKCVHEDKCTVTNICGDLGCRHGCAHCFGGCHTDKCPDYEKYRCERTLKAPYVCNGCEKEGRACHAIEMIYVARKAQALYLQNLKESREGISVSQEEMERLDDLVSPLLLKGQSVEAIFMAHKDEIPCSKTTLYNYINERYLTARNIDLPRKVRFKQRYSHDKRPDSFQNFVQGRTYADYKQYVQNNPDISVWQMDTVIGDPGGKCLLTLLHEKTNFMLAILLDKHTQNAVIRALNRLCDTLGISEFKRLFTVILTDRGTEFGNPYALECDEYGEIKTKIFYCDPYCSWQKGKIEKNHEFIRMVLPKGKSFNNLSQKDIHLMMIHINNYPRQSLNNSTPYEVAKLLLGKQFLEVLHFHKLDQDRIVLKPQLLWKPR